MWLFVFGDNPWPAAANNFLAMTSLAGALLVWGVFAFMAYEFGKGQEAEPSFNWRHSAVAAGVTLLLVAAVLVQQFRVGNLGPRSEGEQCMDFCVAGGYSASGMPLQENNDRVCTCFDAQGNEGLRVPLDEIAR